MASYGVHWLCLFPQHGPGKKHERPIVLDRWTIYVSRREAVAQLDRHIGPKY